MLEYVVFDLSAFGMEKKVSGLDVLLAEMHKFKCEGFAHLIPCIAKDVVSGLSYLHTNGVAHRNIKPSNLLFSNQHYIACQMTNHRRKFGKNAPA